MKHLQVHFWDVGQQMGRADQAAFPPPSPSGEYSPLRAGNSGVTSINLSLGNGLCCLATGNRDGSLCIFSESP